MRKMLNKKGFTLMEMLIVVAIIAVLVAIAIPTFSGALTKSKEAADVANIRAHYASWQTAVLTEGATAPTTKDGFKAAPAGGTALGTLNFDEKLTVSTDGVVTYDPDKVNEGTAYTWSLKDITIS